MALRLFYIVNCRRTILKKSYIFSFIPHCIPKASCIVLNTLQHTATPCNTLQLKGELQCPQHTATHCNTLQHTATHCNTRHCNKPKLKGELHCPQSSPPATATHCNTLQHTATYCNTLQHTVLWGLRLSPQCHIVCSNLNRDLCRATRCNTL